MNTIIFVSGLVLVGMVLIALLNIYLIKKIWRSTKIGIIGKIFSIFGILLSSYLIVTYLVSIPISLIAKARGII
jgi:hypothetical protein